MTIDHILMPPVLLAVAGMLLLLGEWVLRRAIEVILFAFGAVAGHLVCERLIAALIIPASAANALAVMALCGLLVAGLARNEVVLRNLVILATLAACLAAADRVALVTGVPAIAVWIVFGMGAVVSPPVLVGALVTALIVDALQPQSARAALLILLAAVAYSRLRHGSWFWQTLDHRLRARLRATAGVSSAAATATIPVLFRCRWRQDTDRVAGQLRAQKVMVESFPGGYLAAEVPSSTLRNWNHPLRGIVAFQPQAVLSADTPISLPPVLKSDAQGVDLGEIAERVRTDHGEHLGVDMASGRGTVVAIVDTGVRPVNDALRKALIHSEDFTQEGTPDDRCGHGTMVAQHVLAIAPDARIISLKCLDENGSGSLLSVMRALKYIAEQGSKITIINLSLGAPLCRGDGSDPLCEAIAHIKTPAIAAIGNAGPGPGTVECPGCSRDGLGVGAIDADGRVAQFSSRGPCRNRGLTKPDVVSFGVAMRAQDHTGTWVTVSGTSFAAPLTAGIAACCAEMKPSLVHNRQDLYSLLVRSASRTGVTPSDRDACGSGLVNLCRAASFTHDAPAIAPLWLPALRYPRIRLATAAAAAVVAMTTWALLLDHAWTRGQRDNIHMVGRIGHSIGADGTLFTVDDGTRVIAMRWPHPASQPRLGSVAYVAARRSSAGDGLSAALEGRYRFTIFPAKAGH